MFGVKNFNYPSALTGESKMAKWSRAEIKFHFAIIWKLSLHHNANTKGMKAELTSTHLKLMQIKKGFMTPMFSN